jgi:hypothetical protein
MGKQAVDNSEEKESQRKSMRATILLFNHGAMVRECFSGGVRMFHVSC